MYTSFSSKNYRRGLIWTNWFVVIVAIGVVAAVVLPVMNRPRESGHHCTSQSNMHELGIALATYMGDFDDTLPSSALVNRSKTWNSSDFRRFCMQPGLPAVATSKQTYSEVIYDYIKNKDILWSPEDPARQAYLDRDDLSKVPPSIHTSYWWKTAIDKAWFGDGTGRNYRRIKDYAFPKNQIILYEHRNFHDPARPGMENGVQINVCFMDSHVKNVVLKNATSGDPCNCADNSDGEPMYFNYNYKAKTGLPSDKTPAKWTDPAVYCDKF